MAVGGAEWHQIDYGVGVRAVKGLVTESCALLLSEAISKFAITKA